MKYLRRGACLALALLMSLSALSACTTKKNPEDDTSATDPVTGQVTEPAGDPATDPEKQTEPTPADPMEGLLALAGEKAAAPLTILVPKYPALWETAAAEALKKQILTLSGVAPVIAESAEEGALTLSVGTGTSLTASDVGTAGFHVSANAGGVLLYAESEDGMADALAALAGAMTVVDGTVAVPLNLDRTEKKNAETVTPVKLSGDWGDSIAYAAGMADQLNGAYTNGKRSGYVISNSTMTMVYDLHTRNEEQVAGFYNANGVPYFTDSMDVFLQTTKGETVWASKSANAARVNVFRLGYYYRDIHVMDQNFTAGDLTYDESTAKQLLTKKLSWSTHMTSKVEKVGDDGGFKYTVTDSTDPYINANVSFDTKKYNALKIVMRNETASSGEIYINNGKGYNAAQHLGFQLTPGEEFQTYIIMMDVIENYTDGNVSGLRLDIGSRNGELVEIREIAAVTVDSETPLISLDRTYHTYPDKLHEQLHFVCTGEVTNLAAYGMEVSLDASRVKGLCIIDASGEHSSMNDVDWDSVEAVAFDVERAGVVGWILAAGSVDSMRVTKTEDAYVLRITHTESKITKYIMFNQFSMGYRIYNDESHDFKSFAAETYVERNPLKLNLFQVTDGAKVVGYNALRGCYEYLVNGTGFNYAYANPHKQYKVCADIACDDVPRKLYVMTHETGGALENAVLLDDSNRLLPISPEVTKNFGHEKEEPLFDRGDTTYGEAIFPMVLEAGEERQFTILNLYQNWGVFPLKQLSSIQFTSPYYHLSCGVTETNCIAPYYVYGKDFWTLPDFRAWSAPMWSSQPQHTSVGRLHWLTYVDSEGNEYGTDFTDDDIDSSGPVYADVLMSYISDDGKIAASYRHLETPQTDENRTYYEVDMRVLEDISFKDFARDFSIFSFDGRFNAFSRMGYVDESGQEVVDDVNMKDHSDIIKLGPDAPYFDYFESTGDYVCFALLIKDAKITLNGKNVNPHFVIREEWKNNLNYCYLSLDWGETTLHAGDTFHIDMILMPWGSQFMHDDNNVSVVRVDSCLQPARTTAEVGTVIPDNWMPKVKAENNQAVFTVTDGGGRMAVRVYGLTSFDRPTIERQVNGEWVPYVTNHYDYDGYMVYYDNDGTYSVAFVIETAPDTFNTYRVIGE